MVPALLACVCVVQEATSSGGLDLISRSIVAHMGAEGVVADGMALLKTLAHSDVNKRLYCDPAVGTYALLLQVGGLAAGSWALGVRVVIACGHADVTPASAITPPPPSLPQPTHHVTLSPDHCDTHRE